MLDQNNNYILKDYQKKSLFYSFLPGISGEKGIPLWCHYLNRGQAIASFGVQDKDHSIMEFYPAHQAAQRTPLLGFRTFIKTQGKCVEPFGDYESPCEMGIGMNSLIIREELEKIGLEVEVEYESLPEEPVAGLLRKITVHNIGQMETELELADGLAEILPYGVDGPSMKEIGQTTKAWMQVQNAAERVPMYKVRASMQDSACVTAVDGVHYGFARTQKGELLPVIVDKTLIFGEDSALVAPHGFARVGIEELLVQEQCTCNDAACCFFLNKAVLKAGEKITIEELYGMAENPEILTALVKRTEEPNWFAGKRQAAKQLPIELTRRIATKTGNKTFDAYCRQTFLDNLLRGGYPEKIGNKVVYLYSRKHGDMERDYNYFSMLPEYYSQGNGNFRDVNQNRRCDTQFSTFVGDRNIKMFYNTLQLNGYNPLKIEKVSYYLDGKEYTAGELYQEAEKREKQNGPAAVQTAFENMISQSQENDNTTFGEGYWSDHWTYNLDLVENYLLVYPEKKEELFFKDRSYLFRQADMRIRPRQKRYVKTEKGIRQYRFLEVGVDTSIPANRYLTDTEGKIVTATLFEKMFSLATVKMAALDPYGMGIEMEGGKPGWYDALNGLPGLLGSSMAETYELERLVEYLLQIAEKYQEKKETITILTEIDNLGMAVKQAGEKYQEELAGISQAVVFWNAINDAKEEFWERTCRSVWGTRKKYTLAEAMEILESYHQILKKGIRKSREIEERVPATYYYYEVTDYEETVEGILPTAFQVHRTPDFLEGTVHSLKLQLEEKNKKQLYEKVRTSRLFDEKLGMYKVNASLSEASFELGRACAFTTGWLENESVWLHMEYKYLLELLKTGLYEEFAEDFHRCGVPFLDEEVYGRSPLENSSFIASSVNPNPRIHGKGFVARLSGSTAEFLQMWQIMMFGKTPFHCEGGELTLSFAPVIPEYLIDEKKQIQAMFLGTTTVVYHLPDEKAFYPGTYSTQEIEVIWKDGTELENKAPLLGQNCAEKIRNGEAAEIHVYLKR